MKVGVSHGAHSSAHWHFLCFVGGGFCCGCVLRTQSAVLDCRFGFQSPPFRCCRAACRKSRVKAPWMAYLASSRHGCRVEATLLLLRAARLARRAASWGAFPLVTFFVQASIVTRPYQTCFVRSRTLETGEIMPPALNGWWAFSPVLTWLLRCK